jgi:hypothetical protein
MKLQVITQEVRFNTGRREMKTWSFGTRNRLVEILSAVFSMATLICVGADAKAQVAVTVSQTQTQPPPKCSAVSQSAPGGPYFVCVSQEPATAPSGSSTITWTLSNPPSGCDFPMGQGGIIVDKGNKKKTTGHNSWTVTASTPPPTPIYYTATSTKDGKKYAYTINVICGGYLLTYDPTIQN